MINYNSEDINFYHFIDINTLNTIINQNLGKGSYYNVYNLSNIQNLNFKGFIKNYYIENYNYLYQKY